MAFPKAGVVFRKFTFTLWVACATTSLLNVLFGYDTTSFGGVQAIPGFTRHFGDAMSDSGASALSASRASFMSSIAFVGKFIGVLAVPVFIEMVGHRIAIWTTCLMSFVGIIIECTAGPVSQFVVGRIIVYFRYESSLFTYHRGWLANHSEL